MVRNRTGEPGGCGSSPGTLIPGSGSAVTGAGAVTMAGDTTEVGSVRVPGARAGGEERQRTTAPVLGDRTRVMLSALNRCGAAPYTSIAGPNAGSTGIDTTGVKTFGAKSLRVAAAAPGCRACRPAGKHMFRTGFIEEAGRRPSCLRVRRWRYSAKMNRKRREANARRALAAGRRVRPTPSALAVTDLPQAGLEVQPGSMDALDERTEVRVPAV
jgi:hypothetical protein